MAADGFLTKCAPPRSRWFEAPSTKHVRRTSYPVPSTLYQVVRLRCEIRRESSCGFCGEISGVNERCMSQWGQNQPLAVALETCGERHSRKRGEVAVAVIMERASPHRTHWPAASIVPARGMNVENPCQIRRRNVILYRGSAGHCGMRG